MKNTKYSDLPIQAGPLFADLKTLTDGHTFKIEFNNYCIIPQVRLLCCNLFFLCEGAGGGGEGADGRKCETYCEIAHEQSTARHQNRNLKQNLPSTAHEPYMDICDDVMISTPKKLMEK